MTWVSKRMNPHPALIGSAVTLAGAAQLALSYIVTGWASAVLVSTGTASLLFVPLFHAQRTMERRVRVTQQHVDALSVDVQHQRREMRQSLDELRRTFTTGDSRLREEERQDLADVGENPSCGIVRRALVAAQEERVVSKWGMRVHVVDPQVFIFARLFPSGDADVTVAIERRDGEPIAELIWKTVETADQLMGEIAKRLRAASVHPGASFDPALLFQELSKAIGVARAIKDRFTILEDMAAAQQYVPPQWMIYDWGIGAWHEGNQPYYIDRARLHHADLVSHMSEKIWLDSSSFREAMNTALELEDRGRIQ